MIKAYIGAMRSGKTMMMTQDVINYLDNGHVVYTNYRVNWNPNAKRSLLRRLGHFFGYKIIRYPQSNLRTFHNWEEVMNISNAVIALDEGWQYFDSYTKLPMEKRMRLFQSGKWELHFLYTVQRYMMAEINLRWCTQEFWESTLYKIPFSMYPLVIYKLYDLDEDSDSAKLARKGIDEKGRIVDLALKRRFVLARKHMFAAYDTKEDIYGTDAARSLMGQKVDARSADTAGTVDPQFCLWDLFKRHKVKHDDRRSPRVAKISVVGRGAPVVARVPSRSSVGERRVVDSGVVV